MLRPAAGLAVAAVALAAGASSPQRAWACSCLPPDPVRLLAEADAAFTGTLVDRRAAGNEAVFRFAVGRALKGTLPRTIEVVTAADGAACGLEVGAEEVGLVLTREGGAWRSGLCHQAAPQALAAAASPGAGRIVTGEDAAEGLGRVSALAFLAVVVAGTGLFLIRRRYRPD